MGDIVNTTSPFVVQWSLEGALALRNEVRRLSEEGRLTEQEVAAHCLRIRGHGDSETKARSAQQRMSRWMNPEEFETHWRMLKEPEFRNVAAYVRRVAEGPKGEQGEARPLDHAMHFGLMAWFGSDDGTLAQLRTFTGAYTGYRFSLNAVGLVAVGTVDIAEDPISGAVTVVERYQVPGDDGSSHTDYTIEGYLARKTGRNYVLSQHRNGANVLLQIAYIDKIIAGQKDDSPVSLFSGVLSDVESQTFYSSRFACVRGGARKIGCISLEKVPHAIRPLIDQPPRIIGVDGALGHVARFG